jgi:hypothetical protein
MKRLLSGYHISMLSLLILVHPLLSSLQAQTDSVTTITPRVALNYLCTSNDSVKLTAYISMRGATEILALENAVIVFSASDGTISREIGQAVSDQFGNAGLIVPLKGLPSGKEGAITYTAMFAGKGKYLQAEAAFSAKPAEIHLSFTSEDSLRILKVTASRKNEKGEPVPIGGETVSIYVPRMLSLLKIGEIALEEDGTGTLEFPGHLVGDTVGNLEILAKIEENESFGNVQGKGMINWGIHKQYFQAEVPSRELWTPIAPLWMIITLIIMLIGVWAHYAYAVYELVMIKRLSKKEKPV